MPPTPQPPGRPTDPDRDGPDRELRAAPQARWVGHRAEVALAIIVIALAGLTPLVYKQHQAEEREKAANQRDRAQMFTTMGDCFEKKYDAAIKSPYTTGRTWGDVLAFGSDIDLLACVNHRGVPATFACDGDGCTQFPGTVVSDDYPWGSNYEAWYASTKDSRFR